ncbi:MAG: DNA translocase FtsK [Patescibacteria group bacterium]|nr:DNA translocase FtsK [Patescibacteria group bacterium]
MPKKKVKKQNSLDSDSWYRNLKDETRHSVLGIIFLVLALLFSLAAFGKAGMVGNAIYKVFDFLFGSGFFLVPLAFLISSVSLFISVRPHFFATTIIGVSLFLLSSLGAVDIIFGEKTAGYAGYFAALPLLKFFDFWASLIIFIALFIISILIILNTSISLKITKKKKEDEAQEKISEKTEPGASQFGAGIKEIILPAKNKKEKDEDLEIETIRVRKTNFAPPPIDLLESDKGKPSSGDIKANSNIIKRTLQNFGIEVEMGEINVGPSVTQYTLKPAEGIKLSRIIGLQNDLSLALAAHPLRIEAPIPGKSLVGIEIPNSTKTLVGLANLFSEDFFQKSSYPLMVSLGRDVTGKSIFTNLAKMPHLLIAGATGTGKSICIHSIIISFLYKNSPQSLRFIMIDPKRVELTVYNKIPHLLTPVITDAKKAILTLKWGCKEMERRYEILLKNGVRDIASYHEKKGEYNSMPYLVIVIDELADLMATYPREMESSIVRLAQMSRAVGIHLVVSTQRPSVEVITGLIKANITSRVALQVASQIDSRTILDMAGAEKLLGNGDMLYLAGDTAKPKRIQGPFISEKEIKKVVRYLDEQYKETDIEDIKAEQSGMDESLEDVLENPKAQSSLSFNDDDEIDDELYEEARETVIKAGKASTSYLQRKLKIGYARAARLMDVLEERNVVGPGDGAKPREVLIKDPDADNKNDFEENEEMF